MTAAPSQWRTSPFAGGYQDPGRIPDEVWAANFAPAGGAAGSARHLERLIAALGCGDLAAVSGQLHALDVPTLLVWDTGYPPFGIKWPHRLRDMIPAYANSSRWTGHGSSSRKSGPRTSSRPCIATGAGNQPTRRQAGDRLVIVALTGSFQPAAGRNPCQAASGSR